MTEHASEPAEDDGSVWIRSHPDEQGIYRLVLEMGPDDSIPLTRALADAWAREVLSAVAAAEYDAALVRQMRAMGLDDGAVVVMVQEMRADRAGETPSSLIPGLSLTAGVSARTGDGFLTLARHGKPVGQWSMDDAREHAVTMLTAIEVAGLDGAYLRAAEKFGLDRNRALQAVDDLGRFRGEP